MDADDILKKFIEENKITLEDIERIKNELGNRTKDIATQLHSIICEERHISLEELSVGVTDGCSFYAEESMEKAWDSFEHKRWLRIAAEYREIFAGYDEGFDISIKEIAVAAAVYMKYRGQFITWMKCFE